MENVVTNEGATVLYVCMKGYDGGPFLTYPISVENASLMPLPPDGNITGDSLYRQHE